jgi:SAM-dependent methyltransferase
LAGPPPDPTTRFSNRVQDYVRFRPRYPREVLDVLASTVGLSLEWTIADLGSGTGISTELFLDHGNTVFAVEPNREMREAAESRLGGRPGFRSVDGTAESTTLPDRSVDLVAAAQAFHWFDPSATRREILRILRPWGAVALMWNSRRTGSTPFLHAYEQLLLEYGTDYAAVRHENVAGPRLTMLFGHDRWERRVLPNEQRFDLEGLRGRLLSSSYAPAPGHPRHAPMLEALARLFAEHEHGGIVRFEYDTEIFSGRLA